MRMMSRRFRLRSLMIGSLSLSWLSGVSSLGAMYESRSLAFGFSIGSGSAFFYHYTLSFLGNERMH